MIFSAQSMLVGAVLLLAAPLCAAVAAEGEKMTVANAEVTDIVFFDVAIPSKADGAAPTTKRILLHLFGKVAPKTVENFATLARGDTFTKGEPKLALSYKGSPFHRVIKSFMIQGGDFTAQNGTGGFSIYGPRFEDEAFTLKHTEPGILSMANAGANTNSSQFFITTVPTPWLDGRHVVFGKVADEASMAVVREIEMTDVGARDAPLKKIFIEACGVLPLPAKEEAKGDL